LRVKENNAEKSHAIPDDALEALARCLYPAIVLYFESDEGKCEFAEWQAKQQSVEKSEKSKKSKSSDIV